MLRRSLFFAILFHAAACNDPLPPKAAPRGQAEHLAASAESVVQPRAADSGLPTAGQAQVAGSAGSQLSEPGPTPTADADTPPLFLRYPELGARIAFRRLGEFPTPVSHARELSRALAGPDVYVKRDDQSSSVYGGSKVRKLEFLLAEALQQGSRRVVTVGGVASNQAVATALFGRSLGLDVELLLLPQPPSETSRINLLLSASSGATLTLAKNAADADRAAKLLASEVATTLIPAGGSTPLGNLAFVNAAFELDEQVKGGLLPQPARIYIAFGTMGSAVGLALGLALADNPAQVHAVRASNAATSAEAKARALFEETVHFLRQNGVPTTLSYDDLRLQIDGSQLGPGYGIGTPRATRALDLAARTEGLDLEITYTAKTLAALLADAPTLKDRVVVFWNTAARRPDTSGLSPEKLPAQLRGYAVPKRE